MDKSNKDYKLLPKSFKNIVINYRDIICILCFLSYLFITSSSSRSFINFHTNLKLRNREISSGHEEMRILKGMRENSPSSYSIKMESFNTFLKSTSAERYESRPFFASGYNWTLFVYPKGNKNDDGAGFISIYLAIENSTLLSTNQEVYADIRFYIYNKIAKKYFTIQDIDVSRFSVFKTMWGFSKVLPLETFTDPKNGYLYDGDHCEFGVDIVIPSRLEKSELFSVNENFLTPKFTWTVERFSTLLKDYYLSQVFFIGGRSWNIKVYPNGRGMGEGKSLSFYLDLNQNEKFKPYEKIYVRAKLRVLNQQQSNYIERRLDNWYNGPGHGLGYSWGYHEFMSLSCLWDSSKGFIVNDMLMVQVELEVVSSVKYFDFII